MHDIDLRPRRGISAWSVLRHRQTTPLAPAAAFGSGRPAPVWQLDDVGMAETALSFSAYAGEIVHLRGGSPMARLRVLAMAAGFAPAASGSCRVLGHDTRELDDAARRLLRQQSIACVLSGDRLPMAREDAAGADDANVLHCVARPLLLQGTAATPALARARRELDTLCAGHLADCDAASLPDGQARLVLLARAMVVRPRLLVLEQPEYGLPAAALSPVRQALWSLVGGNGTCAVMTTAHPRLMASADRVLDLDLDLAARLQHEHEH